MIAPTLLIGVGGKGSQIIELIMDKIEGDNSQRIQCVVLDTDANDLARIKREHPGIFTVQTSPNMTVGECLKSNDAAREVWFPRNQILESKSLTEGAGQVRAISRLALEQTIVTGGLKPLHEAVSQLQQLGTDEFQQGMRVVVAGTLAGGTGSGLFLPLGLHLKNYLKSECNIKGVNIRGFFLLPDIMAHTVLADNIDQQENMRANAYAALRELDAFVARGDGEDLSKYPAVSFDIPRAGTKERDIYPPILPYDHVFLMDYMNADGKTLKSLEAYMEYAANTIYAFAVSPMSRRSNSTEDNEIRRIADVASNGHCRYVGAGSAEINYPIDRIAEYVALQWAADSIGKEWTQIDKEVEKRAERVKREGGQFNAAEEYVRIFEQKAAESPGTNRFYASLMRQANAQRDKEGEEARELKDITLFDPISAATASASVSEIDDEHDDVDDDEHEAAPVEVAQNPSADAIVVKNDVSGMYIEALVESAESALERNVDYKRAKEGFINEAANLSEPSYSSVGRDVVSYIDALDYYRKVIERVAPVVARQVASQLFSFGSANDALVDAAKSSFGYWLKKQNSTSPNDLIHPNAIRYVSYKTSLEVELLSDELKGYVQEAETIIDQTLNMDFYEYNDTDDDPVTAIALIKGSKEQRDGFIGKITGMFGSGGVDTEAKLAEINGRICLPLLSLRKPLDMMAPAVVMEAVCREALGFFTALNTAYSEFYRHVDGKIPTIRNRIDSIYNSRALNSHLESEDGRLGNSIRYVCADQKSLDAILEKAVRTAGAEDLEGSISAEIFRAVMSKAQHDRETYQDDKAKVKKAKTLSERQRIEEARREERAAFFERAYEDSVIGFWKAKVVEDYAGLIDIDVIEAIRMEARYQGEVNADAIDNYVLNVINGAWILSEVFLQQTVNTNSDRLKACLFDERIIDPEDDRKMDIVNELRESGGESESGVGRNRILFYQASYGYAIKNLDKFKAPHNVDKDDYLAKNVEGGTENGGIYYKAYMALIRRLTDNLSKGSYISPHIDSRWHLSFQFPDIDAEEGERQRYNVIRAFTYALLFGKIKAQIPPSGLKYVKEIKGSLTDLTVKDGLCDTFAEIFEAMMINNRLVYYLLEDCQHNREADSKGALSNSTLARNLASRALGFPSQEVRDRYFPTDKEGRLQVGAWDLSTESLMARTEDDLKKFCRDWGISTYHANEKEEIVELVQGYESVRDFQLVSESLPGITRITSIYELPLFYEATLPSKSDHGDFIDEIIDAIQEIILNYIICFQREDEAYITSAQFFIEQYERYRKTIRNLVKIKPQIEFLGTYMRLRDKVDYWFKRNTAKLDKETLDLWQSIK